MDIKADGDFAFPINRRHQGLATREAETERQRLALVSNQ